VTPLHLSAYTACTCLGRGLLPHRQAIADGRSGLQPCAFETVSLATYIGEVSGVDEVALRHDLKNFDCRNNRLAQMALQTDGFDDTVQAAIRRYGRQRVGVFLGTSTAGILQTELAYRRRDPLTGALPPDFIYRSTHNAFSVADFVHQYFGLSGPAVVVSTACSSSAKVFASAQRMMACGFIDAAIVGGVDSLCLTTLYGFNSLELTSDEPCRPYDAERKGISIGEGAAFILLERPPESLDASAALLLGVGESSDAYHMSSPHPEGRGARQAMVAALAAARLTAEDVDYINLHGTATHNNDAAEGRAVAALFGERTPCSSTKGATGHTLGAAGAVEAILCVQAMATGIVPGSVHTRHLAPEFRLDYVLVPRAQALACVMNNSFGFGGSNCSLLLGRAA
jgi:3-oxoacyl-[acyl-carrier-protein] synthase-1